MIKTPEHPSPQTWADYWSLETCWTWPELFKVNANIFYRYGVPLLNLSPQDRILNIGCGPGFLEPLLSPHVQSIHSMDVSESMLALCKTNCAACSNVQVSPMPRLSGPLPPQNARYSVFLCISVIQYFQNIEDVEYLIQYAKQLAQPGARMLIADIPSSNNLFEHLCAATSSLELAIKRKYFSILIKTVFKKWPLFLKYRHISSCLQELILTKEALLQLMNRMKLKAKLLDEDLSIAANRLQLLIEF